MVCAIDRDHARPTTVLFDNAERHSYSDSSATKLLFIERPSAKTAKIAKSRSRLLSATFGWTDSTVAPLGPAAEVGAMQPLQIPTAAAVEPLLKDPNTQPRKHQPAASPRKILTPLEPFSIENEEQDGASNTESSSAQCTRPSSEASIQTTVDLLYTELERSVEPFARLDDDAAGSSSQPQLPGTPLPEASPARGVMASVRRLNTMGSFHVENKLKPLRAHLNAQKAMKTVRYVASLPHRWWWWLASWTSEGHFDVRMSPLIEDSTETFWSNVTTLLLRQYLSGLVFGLLIAEPTCDLQLLALIVLTVFHLAYLGILKPMIDTVSLFFEMVTLSLQLAILLIFYAIFRDQHIYKSIPLILIVISVFFNVIFHFPATHYGLERQTSVRLVAKMLLSRAGYSVKSRLDASSNALHRGTLAASGRLFGSSGSGGSQSYGSQSELNDLEPFVESTELPLVREEASQNSGQTERTDAELLQPSFPAAATPGEQPSRCLADG